MYQRLIWKTSIIRLKGMKGKRKLCLLTIFYFWRSVVLIRRRTLIMMTSSPSLSSSKNGEMPMHLQLWQLQWRLASKMRQP